MAQADVIAVDNSTGQQVRTGLNANVEAALTNSAGTTPPPVTVPSLWWWHPDGRLAIRNQENANWIHWISWGMADDPGAQNNESAGYPPGALWATLAGKMFKHGGGGAWSEWGSGAGGGGAGGGGMFLNFLGVMRMVDDAAQPALGVDTSGRMRLVEEAA